MNCKGIHGQLEELLDGTLSALESAQIQKHLRTCASCATRYSTLRSLARALKSLPLYQVGPHFNQKVLAAFGHSRGRAAFSEWAKGILAAILLLVSGWMTTLFSAGTAPLNLLKVVRAFEFLLHPGKLSKLLKLEVAKAGLTLIHFIPLWNEMRNRWMGSLLGSHWGFQIILSSFLAGAVIVVLSRNSTSTEKWRNA